MQDNSIIYISIVLICYLIALLIVIIVHVFIYNCINTQYSNFANYQSLSQYKSIEKLALGSNSILNLPIKDFNINSSHNSYIDGNQILENSNRTQGIINALNSGARMLELDVYPRKYIKSQVSTTNPLLALVGAVVSAYKYLKASKNNDNTPVVAHMGPDKVSYTNIVDLTTHLNTIKNHAFKNTSDPLIIYLELTGTDSEEFCKNLVKSFQDIFGDQLYDKTLAYTSAGKPDAWPNMPIKNILNKIIVLCPGSSNNNITRFIIHGFVGNDDNYQCRNYSQTEIENCFQLKNNNLFSRIYPANIYYSSNYSPGDYWCYNHNAVTQNFSSDGVKGVHKTYFNKFKYSNIVPIHANIENENKIIFPTNFRNTLLYEDTILDIEYIKPNTCYRRVSWFSENKKYELRMQNDGNLVLYNKDANIALWSSGTYGNDDAFLQMQQDGNLVLYNKDANIALWSSGTYGNNGAFAYINNKGQLIISYKGKDIKKFG